MVFAPCTKMRTSVVVAVVETVDTLTDNPAGSVGLPTQPVAVFSDKAVLG